MLECFGTVVWFFSVLFWNTVKNKRCCKISEGFLNFKYKWYNMKPNEPLIYQQHSKHFRQYVEQPLWSTEPWLWLIGNTWCLTEWRRTNVCPFWSTLWLLIYVIRPNRPAPRFGPRNRHVPQSYASHIYNSIFEGCCPTVLSVKNLI